MLFHTPSLTEDELAVVRRIEQIHQGLRYRLTEQRRWVGLLRRVTLGRAIQGSNSIEGYNVSLDDAVAALGGEVPAGAESEAWMAVSAYRDAMTYVLQLADDPHFSFDESLVRALHYMMLKYDLEKSPGRYRLGPIHVESDRTKEVVYTAPEADAVPHLMREFVDELRQEAAGVPVIVRAAMAHLNLVMIHPFRDGNGRMARCLQTLVLARAGILAAPFASIEEYLGSGTNTDDYYAVLAEVGSGSWHPERDARPWVRFVLIAHYRQAQTLVRRTQEAEQRWTAVSEEASRRRLPERSIAALFNASMGFRVRNPTYRELAGVSEAMAGRDLKVLVDAGMLEAVGERRGRFYQATPALLLIDQSIRQVREPIDDPFDTISATESMGL